MQMSRRGCVQIKPNLQKQDAASWIWPTDHHHLQLRPKLAQNKASMGDACLQGPEERVLAECSTRLTIESCFVKRRREGVLNRHWGLRVGEPAFIGEQQP